MPCSPPGAPRHGPNVFSRRRSQPTAVRMLDRARDAYRCGPPATTPSSRSACTESRTRPPSAIRQASGALPRGRERSGGVGRLVLRSACFATPRQDNIARMPRMSANSRLQPSRCQQQTSNASRVSAAAPARDGRQAGAAIQKAEHPLRSISPRSRVCTVRAASKSPSNCSMIRTVASASARSTHCSIVASVDRCRRSPPRMAPPAMMHLLAAQLVSARLITELEQHGHQPQ